MLNQMISSGDSPLVVQLAPPGLVHDPVFQPVCEYLAASGWEFQHVDNFDAAYAAAVRAMRRPAVVHLHRLAPFCDVAGAPRLHRIRRVLDLLGGLRRRRVGLVMTADPAEDWSDPDVGRRAAEAVAEIVDTVVACSMTALDSHPSARGELVLQPSGVPVLGTPSQQREARTAVGSPDGMLIILPTSLDGVDGVACVVRTFDAVAVPGVNLVVLVEGNWHGPLEAFQRLRAMTSQHVRVTPVETAHDLRTWLCAADALFARSSVSSASRLRSLAQAYGLAVVAPDLSPADVAAGVWSYGRGDDESLARALSDLIATPLPPYDRLTGIAGSVGPAELAAQFAGAYRRTADRAWERRLPCR